jgi:hypothetical protein
MAAVDVVDAYVNTLPEGGRRLAHAEWGITVRAEALGGEPLDVGLRMADGLLQAKAIALNAVDRLLGLVTEGAIAVRGYAARSRSRNAR